MDFKSPYNRSQYINFFRNQLLTEDFEDHEEEIPVSFKPQRIRKIFKIGEAQSLDLNIYEIEHESENDPRVLISRDAFRFMTQYGVQKALILFISKSSPNYRLSLVTIDLKWEQGKRIEKEYSNPRRYSFFLGPDTKTHTPEEYLIKEGRVKDFDDLKKRFSIEVVNREFYTKIAILFTKLAGGKRKIGKLKFDEEGSLKLLSYSDETLKKEFSVRLIGRLVFCWFLKKKSSDNGLSLLPEELLSSDAVSVTRGFYHHALEPLFFEVLNTPAEDRTERYRSHPWSQVPFLNGGLFTPGHHDFYDIDRLGVSKHLNTLIVPDNWLKELFEVFETYNFTIDENTSIDVELSIEPEMLGRIFENLLAEINPETGETARKATGSYYTPRPIVEYMVDQSLKQYLLTKINNPPLSPLNLRWDESTISRLLSYEDWDIDLSDPQKDVILDALDNIKIIDPACGSGAFPVGILQKMLLILQKVDPESKNWLSRQLAKIENKVVKKELEKKLKRENWDYVHKLGIIQNSIYGVDIQPIAVEISKLRFFLSLIVDESIDDKKPNRGIVPLPNLEFKFVAANSLIGLPGDKKEETVGLFEVADDIGQLKELRDRYFSCHPEEKHKIETEFEEIQTSMFERSLGWKATGSQTLQLSQWSPFSDEAASWFDPEWMFGISAYPTLEKGGKGGFDVVIANPPYVRQEKIKHIKPALKKEYDKFFCGTADIYTYFYKRGIDLLKAKGHLCFIAPNKFMRAGYGKNTRNLLAKEVTPKVVIDFCDLPIFDATTYPAILLVEKRNSPPLKKGDSGGFFDKFLAATFTDIAQLDQLERTLSEIGFPMPVSALKEEGWNLERPEVLALMEKLRKAGTPLGEYVKGRFYYGIKTGLNEAFVINEKTREQLIAEDPKSEELIKPWLRGRDIKKWKAEWAGLYIINIPSSANKQWPWTDQKTEKQARDTFKHSYPAAHDHLSQWEDKLRKRDDKGRFWWELRSCKYYEAFEQSKIVYPNITKTNIFAFDSTGNLTNQKCFIIPTNDLYLLAVLNSKIGTQWFHSTLPLLRGAFFEPGAIFMQQFPVANVSDKEKAPIIKYVEKIIANSDSPDIPRLEKEIDKLIYDLYNLTPEEIAIVEGER
ncbi:MAG TPA: hypothetical protein ENH01_05450 [Nitrospirae bacterium]|nr:hypothetical protein [Nitrospirota bacterium]